MCGRIESQAANWKQTEVSEYIIWKFSRDQKITCRKASGSKHAKMEVEHFFLAARARCGRCLVGYTVPLTFLLFLFCDHSGKVAHVSQLLGLRLWNYKSTAPLRCLVCVLKYPATVAVDAKTPNYPASQVQTRAYCQL